MSSEPVIYEISSDEEEEEGGLSGGDDTARDLLWELLGDEVVILDGDSCASATLKNDCMDSDATGGGLGDDCLVLDSDPENPVSVVDEAGNGSDDLLVVGEKGQLACRDFAHSRDVCVKFPFNSSPHAKHCNLCHCYVCDSPAPCMYWGTGVFSSDHCNSTDKEKLWRTQRQQFRHSTKAGPPVQKLPDTTLSMRMPVHNTGPPHSSSGPFSQRLIRQHASVPEPIKFVASSETSFSTTGNRRPDPYFSSFRNRYPQCPSRSISSRARTNTRERGGISALGPRLVTTQSRFKRSGPSGGAITVQNRSGQASYDANHHIYTALQQPRNQSTQVTRHMNKSQNLLYGIDSELNTFDFTSLPNSSRTVADIQSCPVSSLPLVPAYDQSFPHSEANQNMNQSGNPGVNAIGPDRSEFNCSFPLNVVSQSLSVDTALANASEHPPEASSVMHTEGQHLQNLGWLEFHEEEWMHNFINHEPPIPETASNPMLSDLDSLFLWA